jgi:hypothetical protein
MTKAEVKAVLDRVLAWPEERQEAIVELITAMELGNDSAYQLTKEQAAEVRRRLENPSDTRISIDEVFARYRRP